MGAPSKEALWNWARNYDKLWTAGDREGWIANYRTVLKTDAVRMFDPVATPEKFGFQHCLIDSYDLFQPNVKFHIPEETLFVLGNTVSWVMNNHITSRGKTFMEPSIETFIFEPDGSLAIKTWYRIPYHTNDELGDMFKIYLPDNDGKTGIKQ